jgi:hypothetical protein
LVKGGPEVGAIADAVVFFVKKSIMFNWFMRNKGGVCKREKEMAAKKLFRFFFEM